MATAAAGLGRAPSRRVAVPRVVGPVLQPAPGPIRALAGETMGTTWSVKLAGRPDLPLSMIEAAIGRELDAVIGEMSGWEEHSDLARFNRAPPGSWHVLPDGMAAVLRCALDIAAKTNGAFDPALGALVDLWGFGPSGPKGALPDPAEVTSERARTGWRQVRLDGVRIFQPGGLELDLSGIAKGDAVDRVAAALGRLGLSSFLVEIGGELRGVGVKPDLSPWWVALERPPGADDLPETIMALHGLAVATSGDYRRFHESGGERLAHTLDPVTGAPSRSGLASVSVIHPTCREADAWATAVTVLGPEQGRHLATRHGIAALLVTRTEDGYRASSTPALEALLA